MAEKELKGLVRIANTDLNGQDRLGFALTKIKGVSFMFANMTCALTKLERSLQVGYLTDEQLKKLNDFFKNPQQFDAPAWMLNRRKDLETGENKHLIAGELDFVKDNDLKLMKMIRSYRGVRHTLGLPVRGQRTRSNFRKNKGKVMGVKRRADAKAGK